jgi:hypothetical protein
MKDLKPGDIFLDLTSRIEVISIEKLPFLGIPRTKPKVRVFFKTQRGNLMRMNYYAERLVDVVYEK